MLSAIAQRVCRTQVNDFTLRLTEHLVKARAVPYIPINEHLVKAWAKFIPQQNCKRVLLQL